MYICKNDIYKNMYSQVYENMHLWKYVYIKICIRENMYKICVYINMDPWKYVYIKYVYI